MPHSSDSSERAAHPTRKAHLRRDAATKSDTDNAESRTRDHQSLLNQFRLKGDYVALDLVSGRTALGHIESFDRYSITLQRVQCRSTGLFFKSAIECVRPAESWEIEATQGKNT